MNRLIGQLQRLPQRFESPRTFFVAILLGVLISLPTLRSGLFLDDFPQRIAVLTGQDDNVFDFIHRGSATAMEWMQSGVLPWWTHPDTKIMFYRPVAQALMELDYRLWPDNVALMHLHSVLWYGLLIAVAGLAYRQLMPAFWIAGLAAVLFAIDAPHRGAVSWLACRNALVGMVAALSCLLCYRQRAPYWHLLGCALFALSLATSEGALAIAGYLLAYELCLSDQQWRYRSLRLLPYALVAVAWLAFWKHRGYGAAGPGFYIDPMSDPAQFLSALVYRFPAYLVGQFLVLLPPTEIFSRFEDSPLRPYVLVYAWLMVAGLSLMFIPVLRRSRPARFFAVGMLIAVVPICGSVLYSRALWYVGFGALGLVALAVEYFQQIPKRSEPTRRATFFVAAMVVLHLVVSPLLFIGYGARAEALLARMDSRRLQLPDEGAPGRRVLAVSVQNYGADISFPLLKDRALALGSAPTRPQPAITRIRALTESDGAFELSRKDENTLEVRSATGFNTFRPSRYGFSVGDRVTLDDVDIEIESVSPTRAPTRIDYRFAPGALATYEAIAWQKGRFAAFTLPPPGETVQLGKVGDR